MRSDVRDRVLAVCGIAGPAAFVGAWLVGGGRTPGYDPFEQAISQLAREDAATAPLMTAGFVAFGVLVPAYAQLLGRSLRSPGLRRVVRTSGLATLGVAALPLSRVTGQPVDTLHAVAAGTGYVAQALAPLVGGRCLASRWARRASYAVSAVAGAALVASVAVPPLTGLLQRTGLTLVDAWLALVAAWLLRGGPVTGRGASPTPG